MRKKKDPNEPSSCEHCHALVYGDSAACPQCGRFPVKIRRCKHCGCISPADTDQCWRCERIFEPESDFL